MLDIVLYQPKIPQNTGNIIRLSVNLGAKLHLIRPFGFIWNDKFVRRAAMDYIDDAQITLWNDLSEFMDQFQGTVFAIETGGNKTIYEQEFTGNIALVFGSEDDGLPTSAQVGMELLSIPQIGGRSLNLSNAVAVTAFECMRQINNW